MRRTVRFCMTISPAYSILTDESTGFSQVFPHLRRDVSMESDNVRCRVLRFVANGDAWAGFPAFFAISCCLQIETDLYNKTIMYRRGDEWMFSKDNAQVCALCEHGTQLQNVNHVLCRKKGVVLATYRCRKFAYDPLKREPKRISVLNSGYTPEDFSIT